MSQKKNHRRESPDKRRHQDNGPTFEGGPPNSGCNSTHVAGSRSKWKRIGARAERRTNGRSAGGYRGQGGGDKPVGPEWDDEDTYDPETP